MRSLRSLAGYLLNIYAVVFGDVIQTWRNSLMAGAIVTIVYVIAFVIGLWIGLWLYDVLSNTVLLLTIFLPGFADIAVEIACLVGMLILGTSVSLFCARMLLYVILVLAWEFTLSGIVFGLLSFSFILFVLSLIVAVNTTVIRESVAELVGTLMVGSIACVVLAGWLHIRYRIARLHRHWTGTARVFQHDMGAALHHLSSFGSVPVIKGRTGRK